MNELKCRAAGKCNACQLSNMNYEQQLEWKHKEIRKLLDKYTEISPIIGMHYPYNYRNKAQYVLHTDRYKNIISGIYQSSTGGAVSVDKCLLNDKRADGIIREIRMLMKSFKLLPYSERSGDGLFKHVLIRNNAKKDEFLVLLVGGTPIFPKKKGFSAALAEKCPDIKTIVFSVNDDNEKMLTGSRFQTLYGDGYITDTLCGLKFHISPSSFYQVNHLQTEKLYNKAIELAQLKKTDTILDAYCGIGTIGLICSKHVSSVYGVEINPQAIKDAIANSKLNNIKNTRFICGDAGNVMTDFAAEGKRFDVVFMDPARAGSDKAFLSSLVKTKPKKIVYISCNPKTLARDVEYLSRSYNVETVQPVDMFPHTNHIETIVLLSKQKEK